MSNAKNIVQNLLQLADVQVNGTRPWDIQVHNDKFYDRLLAQGSMWLGEAYMDQWRDAPKLDQFFYKVLQAHLEEKVKPSREILLQLSLSYVINLQTKLRSLRSIGAHYDIGNDLFEAMLDPTMTYTCGYWKDVDNLNDAQVNKLDLVCRKIWLEKGMKVLDIGCGWWSFAHHAATHYGAQVVGVSLSQNQVRLAQKRCEWLPIEIRLQDYRDVRESFDRIISLGMIEHVGYKNYHTYMKTVHSCLKEDGIFLLHTIGGNRSTTHCDPWFNKYIFPQAMVPSVKQLWSAREGLFVMEDWHSFGSYYDPTVMARYDNFNKNREKIKKNYDHRFFRMWEYYLLCCAGDARARWNQLWQIVLTKHGIPWTYQSIR